MKLRQSPRKHRVAQVLRNLRGNSIFNTITTIHHAVWEAD